VLTTTRGIVFRKLNYGETSLIVDIFTLQHGLMSYIIGGVRSSKARTGSALLQLMAIVEIVAYHSDKSKLHRIKEAHSAYVFEHIPGDVRKNAIILFMAELCTKVIRQTEKHEALYRMVEHSIIALDQATAHFADAHILFMIRLADHLGFGPEVSESSPEGVFDLLDGRFVASPPGHEYYISDTRVLNQYLVAARQDEHLVEADRVTRNRMLDALLLYYQLHLDKMPEMYAHKVLREIL
jgi:DNA repair protein RecO (recombination protein O)